MAEDEHQDDLWTRVIRRGRNEVQRAADEGRSRIRAQLLQRDLDAMRIRLGKTAFRLFEEGEIDHPAIAKASLRIREMEDEIEQIRVSTQIDTSS